MTELLAPVAASATGGTPHGSRSTYTNKGCRCKPCRDANAVYFLVRRGRMPRDQYLASVRKHTPQGGYGTATGEAA